MATAVPVRVGRVVKPHGIRGEIVVETTGDTLAGLAPGEVILVGGTEYAVAGVRPHQGRLLLSLAGCEDRNAAEELRGSVVEVSPEALPELGPNEWYVDDIVGWQLWDAASGPVGRIEGVVDGAAHDYVEVGPEGLLVPLVRDWLVQVDEAARKIVMDLPPGLVEDEPCDSTS